MDDLVGATLETVLLGPFLDGRPSTLRGARHLRYLDYSSFRLWLLDESAPLEPLVSAAWALLDELDRLKPVLGDAIGEGSYYYFWTANPDLDRDAPA